MVRGGIVAVGLIRCERVTLVSKMDSTLSYITDQLKALTSIASPTGYTRAATDYLMETLRDMGFGPERSNKGNVLVELGGEGEPLVLASHVDTLGAMVRSIKDNGRLRPTTLGGHQWSTADGENCTVYTRDGNVYTGVVLNTEPSAHVADEPVKTIEKNMEILLDENVDSKDDVLELGIQTGDIIAMDPRTTVTESGYIKSRFLDDKLSAAILLGLARAVAAGEVAPFAQGVAALYRVRGGWPRWRLRARPTRASESALTWVVWATIWAALSAWCRSAPRIRAARTTTTW